MEIWVRHQDVEGFFMGYLIPAVDQVNKDSSYMWWGSAANGRVIEASSWQFVLWMS
jgi:hypothetical protein